MVNGDNDRVCFELSIGTARFRLEGPAPWVEAKAQELRQEQAFKLENSSATASTNGNDFAADGLRPHLMRWMSRCGVSAEQLQHVIHLSGEQPEVIAPTLPGQGRERVLNAYLLVGLASYCTAEGQRFPDSAARDLLKKYGAYDNANHSAYMKVLAGKLVGTKDDGWTLSVPGLGEAANLAKSIATGVSNET